MNKKGFTLVELLIVIAIIGILVAAIAPRYVDFTARAEEATNKANLASLRGAITLYAGWHNGSYPANLAALAGTNACGTNNPCIAEVPTLVNGTAFSYNSTTGIVSIP